MLNKLTANIDHLREMHRKWSDYRLKVEAQYDNLIARVGEDANRMINDFNVAKQDSLVDYDEVLRTLEDQIKFLEGSPQ